MTIQAKTIDNGARNPESTVVELNRVITQAEELLKTLGEEGGAAVEAVRQRVRAHRQPGQGTAGGCRAACARRGQRGGARHRHLRARQSVEGDCVWRGRGCGSGIDRHGPCCAASSQQCSRGVTGDSRRPPERRSQT